MFFSSLQLDRHLRTSHAWVSLYPLPSQDVNNLSGPLCANASVNGHPSDIANLMHLIGNIVTGRSLLCTSPMIGFFGCSKYEFLSIDLKSHRPFVPRIVDLDAP